MFLPSLRAEAVRKKGGGARRLSWEGLAREVPAPASRTHTLWGLNLRGGMKARTLL